MKYLLLVLCFLIPSFGFAEIDQSVPQFIATTAKLYGIDPQLALFISWNESKWNTEAVGDYGTSFGVWQIHNPVQKKIRPLTVDQAKDLRISTYWAMQTMMEDRGCFQWSTCKLLSSNT